MDQTAIFQLTYGVHILATKNKDKENACIINTCIQLTQDPMRVSIAVLKTNLTHDMIKESNQFSISIISKDASLDTIAHFGLQSGRKVNKLEGTPYEKDILGNPLILLDSLATLSCEVEQKIDLDTHTMFIAKVVDAHNVKQGEPMTYAEYRALKAGKDKKAVYQCSVCHYIYDGEIPFEELPDDYVCPICKQPKEVFKKI